MNITDLNSLTQHNQQSILFQCITGSYAYGTFHQNSDQDVRGIFILPSPEYLSLDEPVASVSDERNDTVYYSLLRFLQLAATANPNIIELLFMPEDCVQVMTPYMEQLIAHRELFITKKAYETHIGYAQAQLKKARGQNKWINRPQLNKQPSKSNFCWILLQSDSNKPYPCRPLPLYKTSINLNDCHVSSLEHTPNVYRLYHIGKQAKGVFKKDQIACQSITKDQEVHSFTGLLIFNKQAYESALRDFHNYWEWRKNRNEHRWIKQEKGFLDYDAKNMMHLFRLLSSGKNIFEHGMPKVRFSGEELQFLKDVLSGNYNYDALIKMAEIEINLIRELKEKSSLPDNSDSDKINFLFRNLTTSWERANEK